MITKEIDSIDIPDIANIACECFIDDPFYIDINKNRVKRIEILKSIFIKSINICVNYGMAFGVIEDNEFVGFVLAFNYSELKTFHPDEFSHIFFGSSISDSLTRKMKDEFTRINDEYISGNEFIYLLAVAVKEKYRLQGLATAMVDRIKKAYPQYNIFSDVSNEKSISIYKSLGFDILGVRRNCTFVRYLSKHDKLVFNTDKIHIAVPVDFPMSELLEKELRFKTIEIDNVSVCYGKNPYFIYAIGNLSEAKVYDVTYNDLLCYQRKINVLLYSEILHNSHNDDDGFVFYVSNQRKCPSMHLNDETKKYLCEKKAEWDIIPDCYTSIPVFCNDFQLVRNNSNNSNFLINRLLIALQFRTNYEAGIPIENNKESFKSRIMRFYLGNIKIQIQSEAVINFNGVIEDPIKICDPVEVALVASIDINTNCGVVHMISLSCGLIISQFLDSISRNQISVITSSGVLNLYEYLSSEYKIYKKGSAKTFLTIPRKRKDIPDNLLASLLFCETYYNDGEELGRVADKEILKIISDEWGFSQYNYANVYAYSNILIQISDSFAGRISDRLQDESITLFYIELLLFEEAALNTANDSITLFLTRLDKYGPNKVLVNIDNIISRHVKSIEFWDIRMNYPSSKKSVENIKAAFKIVEIRDIFNRNLEQLFKIYNTRSDIIDKAEYSILTAIGAVLTVISVMSLAIDSSNRVLLYIASIVVVIVIVLKNLIFKKLLKRKR